MKITEQDLIDAQGNPEKMAKLDCGVLEVTGYLYLGALTSLPANAKLTAGGYLYLGALKHPTEHKGNNPLAGALARTAVAAMFHAIGYTIADGILARIVQRRGPVMRVIICGKTEVSYLVTNGEAWSHGKTLAEARDGLIYKIGSRDMTKFKAWKLDRVVTKAEAIEAYRVITGACEEGTKAWMGQRKTPEKVTVRGIIDLTKGAFGADTFRKFFAKEAA